MFTLLNRWLPPAAWMAVIFYLSSFSSLPGPSGVAPNFLWHKLMHMFVYAVLYFLLYRAFNQKNKNLSWKSWTVPMLLTVLYAASDELHQSYVPGRTPAFHDIGYDALGATIALLKVRGYI